MYHLINHPCTPRYIRREIRTKSLDVEKKKGAGAKKKARLTNAQRDSKAKSKKNREDLESKVDALNKGNTARAADRKVDEQRAAMRENRK